jgi:hypothetical protein
MEEFEMRICPRVHYLGTNRAKASDYISRVGTVAVRGVIIVCRVSKAHQRGHLADQEANLRRVAARAGLPVLGVVNYVGNGSDPLWLATVADEARRLNAALLAETTCRFIRSPHFSPKLPAARQELPSLAEFYDLRQMTDAVQLLTAIDPDAPPPEMRSCHRKRGQQQKGRLGGRPEAKKPGYKKAYRSSNAPMACQLRQEGYSIGNIARMLNVAKSTVQGWLNFMG